MLILSLLTLHINQILTKPSVFIVSKLKRFKVKITQASLNAYSFYAIIWAWSEICSADRPHFWVDSYNREVSSEGALNQAALIFLNIKPYNNTILSKQKQNSFILYFPYSK